ncbi:MAG: hypothetical protein M0T73_15205 [Deltaproteobacteria bacterium]|nr:hypothetical protein [Deltaproteobacteria bacterium]
MKKLSITFMGLVAGTLLLLGANCLSVAGEGATQNPTAQVTARSTDQRLAYRVYHRPYCYRTRRCVRVNRFGYCKRWKWIRVCPGWRI